MSEKYCPNYTGVACIDGTCPKAREEELRERCEDVSRNCRECWLYRGCEDCYFDGDCDEQAKRKESRDGHTDHGPDRGIQAPKH